jgi:hypothetical protein
MPDYAIGAVESSTPKAVREALCAAQSALTERAERGVDVDRVPVWIGHLQRLIDAIDTAVEWGVRQEPGVTQFDDQETATIMAIPMRYPFSTEVVWRIVTPWLALPADEQP